MIKMAPVKCKKDDKEALLIEDSEGESKSKFFKDNYGSIKSCPDQKNTWRSFLERMELLWPLMWPRGDILLQIQATICFVILLAGRGLTVLIPIMDRSIVNSLTLHHLRYVVQDDDRVYVVSGGPEQNDTEVVTATTETPTLVAVMKSDHRWNLILIYVLLRTLGGNNGYLTCLRNYLWIRVSQHARKRLLLDVFSHLHNLSIRWHIGRKIGEVLKVMDRGSKSINTVLSQLTFNIAPVLIDIIIAVFFFVTMFDLWLGLIVLGTMLLYLALTAYMSRWRAQNCREKNFADNNKSATTVDSILNAEAVKYYTTEEWELRIYAEEVDRLQASDYKLRATNTGLSAVQKTIMMGGLLAGCLLVVSYVYSGRLTVGDYVLFVSYIDQLYAPLTNFASFYSRLQTCFVDMEHMLDLLKEEIEVNDIDGAGDLKVSEGSIEFNNVWFSYLPKKPVLQNFSLHIPAGKTYALVGDSGGGKSTLTRLLLRFYDIKAGCIKIDGQDISKVKQRSLRRRIGIVPQDTTLFHQDIRYNIRYGRVDATDEEIYEAAKAADIHDRILSFPEGYDGRVGERGLKLSGGEKQRIAIARAILKEPDIVLLDEATSSLDTKTERNIQASLARLCQNKTTLVVAHRLSTIVNADKILVIKAGHIVESGRHVELLELNGLYAQMWREQLDSGEIDQSTDSETSIGHDRIDNDSDSVISNQSSFSSHTSPNAPRSSTPGWDSDSETSFTNHAEQPPLDHETSRLLSSELSTSQLDPNQNQSMPNERTAGVASGVRHGSDPVGSMSPAQQNDESVSLRLHPDSDSESSHLAGGDKPSSYQTYK